MLQQIEDYLVGLTSASIGRTPNFYLENNSSGTQYYFKNIDGVAFLCRSADNQLISMGWLHGPVWVEEAVYTDINNKLSESN